MDYPVNVSLGDPTGEIVTADELAGHLGGIAATPAASQLALTIGAATWYIEQALRYSFRERTVTVKVEGVPGYILLPWGEASDVRVTVEGAAVAADRITKRREFRRVDCLRVDGYSTYDASYTVGSEGPYPDIVQMAVLRACAAFWHDRQSLPSNVRGLAEQNVFTNFAISGGIRRADILDMLSDWT